MAAGERARTAENLRGELRNARHIIDLTRASLPMLAGPQGRHGEQDAHDLLWQLAELDLAVPRTPPTDGRPSLADVMLALPHLTVLSQPQVDALDAALKDFDDEIRSLLDEHDGQEWRERALGLTTAIRPYLVRVSLSVAAGLLATVVTAALAGPVVVASLLVATAGLLVSAICAEAQALVPQSRPAPDPSAHLVARHMDLASALGDLTNLLDRASDPRAKEEWLPLVQRASLTAAIIAIDTDQESRKFAWAGAPGYLAMLHTTRVLLVAQATAPAIDPATREHLTSLADRFAATHPPADLHRMRQPASPPTFDVPVTRGFIAFPDLPESERADRREQTPVTNLDEAPASPVPPPPPRVEFEELTTRVKKPDEDLDGPGGSFGFF